MAKRTKIVRGLQFRAVIADCNALWETIRPSGRSAWICEVVNEPWEHEGTMYTSDYAGQQQAFLNSDIQRAINAAAFWKNHVDESENWYNGLTLGSTVHYCDGFDKFVRCEVIDDDGEKKLLPFALVGEWHKHDLPYRYNNGEICVPYWAEKIQNGVVCKPNASNIFECPQHSKRPNEIDPRNLPEISLEVPPMTPEEEEQARLVKLAAKVVEILHNYEVPIEERLEAAKKELEKR
jgi:hypothetical protein